MELCVFDHYCNFVAPLISPHDNLRRMWQYDIPYQAKTHSFLMHNILSTSAHHLSCAYARPSQWQKEGAPEVSPANGASWQLWHSNRYERFALEQQRLAFQTFIPSLRAPTVHNQDALCAASALISLNSLASTQNRYHSPTLQFQQSSPIDDWLEISMLVRGVDAVIKTASTSIRDGALQPLLRHRRVESFGDNSGWDLESQVRCSVPPHVLSALDALAPAIDQCLSGEADRKVLHAALWRLRISFAIVLVNPDHEAIVMVWSNLLDTRFFPFVKRREPMALVLLAYWTVAIRTFRARWFIGGLSITILRHIAEYLTRLDQRVLGVGDEPVQDGDCVQMGDPLPRSPGGAEDPGDPTAGMAKWRDLLEWPLRESGIHDL